MTIAVPAPTAPRPNTVRSATSPPLHGNVDVDVLAGELGFVTTVPCTWVVGVVGVVGYSPVPPLV